MHSHRPAPLWAGRSLALVGIVILSLSLRQVVSAISPIVAQISVDVPLGTLAMSVLGLLPPLVFALFGFVGPAIVRRLSIERALILSLVLIAVGHLVRALAPDLGFVIGGTFVTLAGMGIANVLLPPLVKMYFPDRIGLLTAVYASLMPLGAAMPAATAVQLATQVGWRFSLGIWAAFALAALVPWLIVFARGRRKAAAQLAQAEADVIEDELEPVSTSLLGRLWLSRTAVAITLAFALCAINVYAGFTFLPTIVEDQAGVTQEQAALLLTVWTFTGAPIGFIAPILVARVRNIGWLMASSVAFFVVGYLGLILVPSFLTWLWVVLAGIGPIVFSACLALIGLRSRTHEGAVALSGFVQGAGYVIGALGPLVVGLLHDASSGWNAPLVFLIVVSAGMIVPAIVLRRPRMIEDELIERAERRAAATTRRVPTGA